MKTNTCSDADYAPVIRAGALRSFGSATEMNFLVTGVLVPLGGFSFVVDAKRGFYSSVQSEHLIWNLNAQYTAESLVIPSSSHERHIVEGAATEKDLDWFFADRDRVNKYAGCYVAIAGESVIGVGTASEAYEQARQRGVRAPLLLDLRHADAGGDLEFGL
jgi:hypothetical protein